MTTLSNITDQQWKTYGFAAVADYDHSFFNQHKNLDKKDIEKIKINFDKALELGADQDWIYIKYGAFCEEILKDHTKAIEFYKISLKYNINEHAIIRLLTFYIQNFNMDNIKIYMSMLKNNFPESEHYKTLEDLYKNKIISDPIINSMILSEINEFNLFLLEQNGICIVTPDTVGPVKNGGIGTTCFHFAFSLSKNNIPVTIMYTGNNIYSLEEYISYRKFYKKFNINFIYIPTSIYKYPIYNSNRHLLTSIEIADFLSRHKYSLILFQDWLGNGFVSIREKQLGRKFINTHLSIICQSTTEWHNEGMKIIPKDLIDYSLTSWIEKESIINADSIVCTSRHMADWLLNHDYKNNNINYIKPTYNKTIDPTPNHASDNGLYNLAFFGRLEKRKGLDIFLEAIKNLDKNTLSKIETISFLGKHALVDGIPSSTILEDFKQYLLDINSNINICIHNDKNHEEAIDYLIQNNCIAIAPSILDNAPMAIIECLFYQIPIIASESSGIKEYIEPKNLFIPNADGLKQKLIEIIDNKIDLRQKQYAYQEYENKWIEFIKTYLNTHDETNKYKLNNITIDICIPYYNHGEYIKKLIKCINEQTKLVNKIYIVDDGSDYNNKKILKEIQSVIPVEIISQTNNGPGSARNRVLEYSSSNYIIFIDADNVPYINFVEQLYDAIDYSQNDVIFAAFNIIDKSDDIIGVYIPLGNNIDLAYRTNVIGDSCCIVKRSVLEKCKFPINKNIHEDWIWGIELLLNNYKVSAISYPIFDYRKLSTSRNITINTNKYQHAQELIDKFSRINNNTIKNDLIKKLIYDSHN